MWKYDRQYSEIYHHGVLGQKWGQRNGPPYPLSPKSHSVNERRSGYQKSRIGQRNEDLYETDFPSRPDKKKRLRRLQRLKNAKRTNSSSGGLTSEERKKYIKENGQYTMSGRKYFLDKAKKDYRSGNLTKEQYKRQTSDIKRNVSNGQIMARMGLKYLKDAGAAVAVAGAGYGASLIIRKKMATDPQFLMKIGSSNTAQVLGNLKRMAVKAKNLPPVKIASRAAALAPAAGAGYEFYNKYRKRDDETDKDKKKLKG